MIWIYLVFYGFLWYVDMGAGWHTYTMVYSFVCFGELFAQTSSLNINVLSGCQIAWQRFEVHLDAVRARTLPEPWPWIWVLNEETRLQLAAGDPLDCRVLGKVTEPRPPQK